MKVDPVRSRRFLFLRTICPLNNLYQADTQPELGQFCDKELVDKLFQTKVLLDLFFAIYAYVNCTIRAD